jgi:hypothetical protein
MIKLRVVLTGSIYKNTVTAAIEVEGRAMVAITGTLKSDEI